MTVRCRHFVDVVGGRRNCTSVTNFIGVGFFPSFWLLEVIKMTQGNVWRLLTGYWLAPLDNLLIWKLSSLVTLIRWPLNLNFEMVTTSSLIFGAELLHTQHLKQWREAVTTRFCCCTWCLQQDRLQLQDQGVQLVEIIWKWYYLSTTKFNAVDVVSVYVKYISLAFPG